MSVISKKNLKTLRNQYLKHDLKQKIYKHCLKELEEIEKDIHKMNRRMGLTGMVASATLIVGWLWLILTNQMNDISIIFRLIYGAVIGYVGAGYFLTCMQLLKGSRILTKKQIDNLKDSDSEAMRRFVREELPQEIMKSLKDIPGYGGMEIIEHNQKTGKKETIFKHNVPEKKKEIIN